MVTDVPDEVDLCVTLERDFDAAFTELYPLARRLARRLLPSMADAEDAAAEALARTLVRWNRVCDLPHRDAWVMRVTANVALDMLRRRKLTSLIVDPVVESDLAEVVGDRLEVGRIVGGLPRRQREVLVLRHVAGLSEHDTAAAMGISPNSVKTHTRRALRTVRALEESTDG